MRAGLHQRGLPENEWVDEAELRPLEEVSSFKKDICRKATGKIKDG
jgi:hypothetical protein